MKIGFLTAVFKSDLESLFEWAQNQGFENIEIGGVHAGFFHSDFVDDIEEMLSEYDIKISAIGRFTNWLDNTKEKREELFKDLYDLIDTASGLKVPCITTFLGLNNQLSYEGNLDLFKNEWIPIIEYAQDKKVKIAIENCPAKKAYGLFGDNLMISPGIWNDLFAITPENFGLNYDPSHLYWQSIDPALPIEEFPERIHHVHVKDCKINHLIRDFVGVFGNGTYTYPLPGKGDINWNNFFGALKEINYKGTLSIEHEDGNFMGTDEKTKEGLLYAKEFIQSHL